MRKLAYLALTLLAACHRQPKVASSPARTVSTRSNAITTAGQLLAAMHDRYAGKWYRNLAFVQKSTYLRPDGSESRVETWYEAGAIPGKLRIDLGDPSRGNGVLYRADSVYQVQQGRITSRSPGRNPLLLLGFDVYVLSPARTLQLIRDEHIDIDMLHTETYNGTPVYVVGAREGDSTSNQFWIDANRLLFLRLIQTEGGRTRDVRFEKYVKHGGGWVAEEVRMFIGGRMQFHEEYSNVRVNVNLDDDLFTPEKWSTATHWFKR